MYGFCQEKGKTSIPVKALHTRQWWCNEEATFDAIGMGLISSTKIPIYDLNCSARERRAIPHPDGGSSYRCRSEMLTIGADKPILGQLMDRLLG